MSSVRIIPKYFADETFSITLIYRGNELTAFGGGALSLSPVSTEMRILLKGKARIHTDDFIAKTRRCRNQHSMTFQIHYASLEAVSFFKLSGTRMTSLIL